ncbi:MAG: hypothetical protein JWN43_3488 [Gammaproteobacteria bacterium]|nr:hypothetical protein [Gammaproteobacteria bacterium]
MREPEVIVPVACPRCGAESVARLDVSRVADALLAGKALRLAASCHSMEWEATQTEIEQIREYLTAWCIDLHGAVGPGAQLQH